MKWGGIAQPSIATILMINAKTKHFTGTYKCKYIIQKVI